MSSSSFPPALFSIPLPSSSYDVVFHTTNGLYKFQNWAESVRCYPAYYHQPTNIGEIQTIFRYAGKHKEKIRIVANGHSPSDIAVTSGHMISMLKFNKILDIDSKRCQITVESGVGMDILNEIAAKHGMTFPTQGAVSDQSIGGSLGTGTHGTGNDCQIISGIVTELHLLTLDGKLYVCSTTCNPELFSSSLVNLGCLGIIIQLTLQLEPAFDLEEETSAVPFDTVINNMEKIINMAPYSRLHYYPHTDKVAVTHMYKRPPNTGKSRKRWYSTVSSFFSSLMDKLITFHIYQFLLYISLFYRPLARYLNMFYVNYMYPYSIKRIDRNDRLMNFDCLFSQWVTEWAIPHKQLIPALKELKSLISRHNIIADWPIEVRFVKKDEIYLSPSYGSDTAYINIISYRPYKYDDPLHEIYFHQFESMMLKFGGRPHWAKSFKLPYKTIQSMYPKYQQFKLIRDWCDPDRLLCNQYIDRIFPNETNDKKNNE